MCVCECEFVCVSVLVKELARAGEFVTERASEQVSE